MWTVRFDGDELISLLLVIQFVCRIRLDAKFFCDFKFVPYFY